MIWDRDESRLRLCSKRARERKKRAEGQRGRDTLSAYTKRSRHAEIESPGIFSPGRKHCVTRDMSRHRSEQRLICVRMCSIWLCAGVASMSAEEVTFVPGENAGKKLPVGIFLLRHRGAFSLSFFYALSLGLWQSTYLRHKPRQQKKEE